MADTIRKVDYFSTEVPNTPGQTFRVLSTLVSAGINLLACNGSPLGRRARIDVVPDDTRKFNAAARKAGLKFKPKKTGFLIQGDDRPGALASEPEKTRRRARERHRRGRPIRGEGALGRDPLGQPQGLAPGGPVAPREGALTARRRRLFWCAELTRPAPPRIF